MVISNALIRLDRKLELIPIASTVTNLVDIFIKCVLAFMRQPRIDKCRYFKYLNQKSIFRCIILLVPLIGNIIIAVYDRRKIKIKPPQTDEEIFNGLKATAKKGNPQAMYELGDCYMTGTGTSKDEKEGIMCYIRAENLGHPSAREKLKMCYDLGINPVFNETKKDAMSHHEATEIVAQRRNSLRMNANL